MRPRRATRLLLACLALGLTACPRPMRFGPEGEITEPEVLARLLDRRSAQVLSIKAEARVGVKSPRQSGTVGEFIAALRPNALHLETLNFFGKPVAVLVSDGENFSLFTEDEGAFFTGPATATNVSRLLPVELDPREVVMLLLGDVPRIPALRSSLAIDSDRRAYLLNLERGPVVQRLWVGLQDHRPLRSEVRGVSAYDLTLSDYQAHGPVLFPHAIDIIFTDESGRPSGTELSIRYKDVEINPPVDLSLFTLAQPPNTRRIEVDAQGQTRAPSGQASEPDAVAGPSAPDAEKEPSP